MMPDAYLAGLDPAARVETWRERIARPAERTDCLVLTNNDELAGFGICGPARLAELGTDGEVFAINVLAGPARQCRGGTALMASMSDRLAARKFASVGLWTLDLNRRGVLFYKRLGGKDGATRNENDFGSAPLIDRAFTWPTAGALGSRAHALAREAGWA